MSQESIALLVVAGLIIALRALAPGTDLTVRMPGFWLRFRRQRDQTPKSGDSAPADDSTKPKRPR